MAKKETREIKFRVWDGERLKPVTLWGFHEGFIMTSKGSADEEEFEVMQFTGLRDKNGKEIYEGDIIKANTFDENINKVQVGKVKYRNERHGYIFVPNELEKNNLYYPLFAIVTCELMGNIYENPEFLMRRG